MLIGHRVVGLITGLIAGSVLAGAAIAQDLRTTASDTILTPSTFGNDILVQERHYEEVLAEFDLIGKDLTPGDRMELYRACTLQCKKDFPPVGGDTKDRQACIAGCAVVAAGS